MAGCGGGARKAFTASPFPARLPEYLAREPHRQAESSDAEELEAEIVGLSHIFLGLVQHLEIRGGLVTDRGLQWCIVAVTELQP